jgi:hypothetical protein
VLLTEDLQDGGVFGGVAVRSPFTLAIEEAAAVYAVAPRPPGGIRRAGGPRLLGADNYLFRFDKNERQAAGGCVNPLLDSRTDALNPGFG